MYYDDNIRKVRQPRFLKNPRARKSYPTPESTLQYVEYIEKTLKRNCEHKEIYHCALLFIQDTKEELEEYETMYTLLFEQEWVND